MNATIDYFLERLLQYGVQRELITKDDVVYCRNQLMDQLSLTEINPPTLNFDIDGISTSALQAKSNEAAEMEDTLLADILTPILDWAYQNGRMKNNTVTERDLLDTRLMGCLTPRPSEVIRKFMETTDTSGIKEATKWFYDFSKNVHYIRKDRIKKNLSWSTHTSFGRMEITINLSKPEKDPKEIEAAKLAKKSDYPLCVLCKENEGYAGRLNHPARQNLRTIPVNLDGEEWKLQFSPYVYYNEHAIIFSSKHEPMKITRRTFQRLLDFVGQFPHYFLGSNADLPIVGGSILSHDHFQGGNHRFPMEEAEVEKEYNLVPFPEVHLGMVKWPMSVLRLTGERKDQVVDAAFHIFEKWKQYNDPMVGILSHTDGTPHNTVTPIARMKDGKYQIDLVLRNNRTNEEHPMGIFHPHSEVHHIKKENIGLIEVMGLAVLPGRLIEELRLLEQALLSADPDQFISEHDVLEKHRDWAIKLKVRNTINEENCRGIIQQELGDLFSLILEHAGVFKRDEQGQIAFRQFINSL